MAGESELFSLEQIVRAPVVSGSKLRCYYVTNGANMRGILSSGLIRPKDGCPKYAADLQELVGGYLPLFFGGFPRTLLSKVTEHDRHDLPVVLEFDAEEWGGNGLLCLDSRGKKTESAFKSLPKSTCAVLVSGVIPLADLQTMYFKDAKDAERFLSDCSAMDNTRPDLLSAGSTFDGIPDIDIVLPSCVSKPSGDTDAYGIPAMRRLDAVGGVLSATLRMHEHGGQKLLGKIFPEWRPEWEDSEGIGTLKRELEDAVVAWVNQAEHVGAGPQAVILKLALDALSSQPFASGLSPEKFLTALSTSAEPGLLGHRDVLKDRLDTIRASALHDQDPAKLFQDTGSCVMRGILLLLLDDAYREPRRFAAGCSPSGIDLLIAEILRGALHGWTRVPVAMRSVPRAELAVGYAMARLAGGRPGTLKLANRSFEWVDESALFLRLLGEVLRGVNEQESRERLRRYASTQGATNIEIKINIKPFRKLEKPKVTRGVKGEKLKKICFQLDLPW